MITLYILIAALILMLLYLAIAIEDYKNKMEKLYSTLKKLDFSKFELSDENKRLIYYGRKYKELMRDYMDDDVLATAELYRDFMKGEKED